MTPSLVRRFDVAEMCQEAAERAGIEFRSGYALTSARRSLELLQLEWANRGLNLWCIERFESPVYSALLGVVELPSDTVDVLDAALHEASGAAYPTIYPLGRLGLAEIPYSWTSGRPGKPTSYFVHRTEEPPWVELKPALDLDDNRSYVFVCWRLRYMRKLASGAAEYAEMPARFVPAMISGLAYMLALKSKDAGAVGRVGMLKQMYEAEFDLASQEDRDRASVRLTPEGGY